MQSTSTRTKNNAGQTSAFIAKTELRLEIRDEIVNDSIHFRQIVGYGRTVHLRCFLRRVKI